MGWTARRDRHKGSAAAASTNCERDGAVASPLALRQGKLVLFAAREIGPSARHSQTTGISRTLPALQGNAVGIKVSVVEVDPVPASVEATMR
jgi:hypothetical protein